MAIVTEVDKPISLEAIRRDKLKVWTNVFGLYACPKCRSANVTHVTIANEGEKLICTACKYEEVVAKEERKMRRGLSI